MIPVWKDKDVYISATEPLNYFIEYYGGDAVFEGVAVPKPNSNSINIRINDFAKNMVNSDVDADRIFDIQHIIDYFIIPNYCREIAIGKRNESSGNTLLFSDYFCNDYDYNSRGDYSYDNIHFLNSGLGYIGNNGYTLVTFFNTYENEIIADVVVEPENGEWEEYWLGEHTIPPMSAVIYSFKNLPSGARIALVNDDFGTITIGNVIESCNNYKLHYINAKGGYETLPIDGRRDKRTDNLAYEYYKSKGNNQNINKPQMNKFKVDITPKWELQTGWLSDEQSKKMYNLFTSQKVWLEDIDEGTFTPVYITNNAVEYKTFTNNGRKKYNYSISVTSANTLIKL